MKKEYAKHETDLINKYQAKGFIGNYRIENSKLVDAVSKKVFVPNEVYIVGEHRYEGMSDPSDMSILYVLETEDGGKGTFLVGYGPAGDLEAAEFFKDIPEINSSNSENLNFKD